MVTKRQLWIGWILTAIPSLFMTFDGVIHMLKIDPVVTAFAQLGWPLDLAVTISIIEFICLALYLTPQTSVLGAILLTGYLGGAVATNLRAGMPLVSNTLFPVYVGIFIWGGLYFRDAGIRNLIPFWNSRSR